MLFRAWYAKIGICWFCTLFGVFLSGFSVDAENSCLGLVLRKPFLDFVVQIGKEALKKEIESHSHLPSVTIPINNGPGHGKADLNNIDIKHVSVPSVDYSLMPSDSIGATLKGGSASVLAEGYVYYKVWFVPFPSFYFKAEVSGSNLDYKLLTTLHKTDAGRLKLNTVVTGSVHNVKLHIYGSVVAWIVNLFKFTMIGTIKEELNAKIKSSLEFLINDKANALLSEVTTSSSFFKDNYTITMWLTNAPTISNDDVTIYACGKLQRKGHPAVNFDASKQLPSFTVPPGKTNMLSALVSSTIVQTFLNIAHAVGDSSIILTKSSSKELAKYLRTSCSLECIGTFIPVLKRYARGSDAFFTLKTNRRVQISLKNGGFELQTSIHIEIFAEQEPSNQLVGVDLHFNGSFMLNLTTTENGSLNLTGSAVVHNVGFHNISSNIGSDATKGMEHLGKMLEVFVPLILNQRMNKGKVIQVPLPIGLKAKNLGLRFHQDYLQIQSDLGRD